MWPEAVTYCTFVPGVSVKTSTAMELGVCMNGTENFHTEYRTLERLPRTSLLKTINIMISKLD